MIVWGGVTGAALFQHRREILRRCTESDTHANTFSDPNRDSYGDSNCTPATPRLHRNATQRRVPRQAHTDAEAAPDPAPRP